VLSPLQWRDNLGADSLAIEARLLDAAVCDDASLTEISKHLIAAGGDRIRASFVGASGLISAADPTAALSPQLLTAGVSVELVHVGSMYHDDVIDDARTRGGVESVNSKWGDLKAILAGDFLLARASELAAALSTEIAQLLAETIGWLCEGQVKELRSHHDTGRSEAAYLDAIGGKTAALFGTACRIGGLVGGLGSETTEVLTSFGRQYGFAFQIIDDVRDFSTGGSDLASGIYTLPVIQHLAGDDAGQLRALLARSQDPSAIADANLLVASSPSIRSALDVASEHVTSALSLIENLEPDPAVDGLRAAAENLVPRH
jgi:heptaprenyl diphosphate synthase